MCSEFLLPCEPAPPIVLTALDMESSNQPCWMVATQPVTFEQWHSIMGSESGKFGCDPGYATKISWSEAKEFCRRLTVKNRESLNSFGNAFAVNLPTFQQWESTLASIRDNMVIYGLSESEETEEPLRIGSSEKSAKSIVFLDRFREMCVDSFLGKYRDIEIGTLNPNSNSGDSVSVSPKDCKLFGTEQNWSGVLLPDIRDVRVISTNPEGGTIVLGRLYGCGGYGGVTLHSMGVGFRVAIHSIASGIASGRSPEITKSKWGRVVVQGCGSYKDVKIFPGGARNWDWQESSTRHDPGVGIPEVMELVEFGATEIILGCGYHEKLGVTSELQNGMADRGIPFRAFNTETAVEVYNELAKSGVSVGALIHSTC